MTWLQNNCELQNKTMALDSLFTLARFPVGQNIAVTWTTRTNAGPAPDFPRQVRGWFNEVRHFGFYSTRFTKGTGHYSQVGIKISPRYHVLSLTHEDSFYLGSDGADGSRSIRCLRSHVKIRWIDEQLCLVA
jgi:hypothetical protein